MTAEVCLISLQAMRALGVHQIYHINLPRGRSVFHQKFSHAMAAMAQGKLQIWRWNALNGHAKQFLKPLRGSDKETTSKLALDVSGPGGYMIHDTCMHFKMEEI